MPLKTLKNRKWLLRDNGFYVDPVATVLFKYWKVNWKAKLLKEDLDVYMWLDDIKDWTKLDSYASTKRTAEDRISWRS